MIAQVACPCCGANATRVGALPVSTIFAGRRVAPIPGGALYRCPACALKFRFPTLQDAEYASLYDNGLVSTWPMDDRRNDWKLIVAAVERLKPGGGNVLDFGCNTGELLAKLDARYVRHGVEVNEAAGEVAESATQATVWRDLDQLPSGRRFDVIVAVDTIEHFRDPLGLLSRLLDRLEDDGILLLTTGDAECPQWTRMRSNWWYCAIPEHVAFVSRHWLHYFSGRLGYSIVDCRNFRYARMSPFQRLCGYAAIHAYGLFPRAYRTTRRLFRATTGRGPSESLPGVSVTADHLFAVLTREAA